MIKPIETIYKGFRFRSRLEARWAVFFDELGLLWEYEKEGYDINGEWYLPDFYFPRQKTIVEIKPLPEPNVYSIYPKVGFYFAGKITGNDWRDNFTISGDKLQNYFNYCGPHFKHKHYEHGEITNSSKILEECINGINQCDILFAWLNSIDHHATLVEIGYAKGIGKKIWVGASYSFHDLIGDDYWFIYEIADRLCYGDNATESFKTLIKDEWLKYGKYSQLSQHISITNVIVVYGSPGYDYTAFDINGYMAEEGCLAEENETLIIKQYNSLHTMKALEKAKQARFEHGEKG